MGSIQGLGCEETAPLAAAEANVLLTVSGTVNSKMLEHGCRMVYTHFSSSVWGWGMVMFQRSAASVAL